MRKLNDFRWLLAAAFSVFVLTPAWSQIAVRGKVTDSKQNSLIGVTVMVKNASSPIVTITDLDGNFQLNVPDRNAVLTASFIGFETAEEPVGDRSVVNFVLQDDVISIDDVIVIGYGVQQKSHLTGAISKLDGGLLADLPLSDVATALQGQISGLSINQLTSEVGVMPEVRVRGISSVGASSSPLVVVDGFPIEDGLQSVNAADILSIEVLKDAASAAIYGSRAANGVIMITTKSGVVDRPRYAVKFYSGLKYAYQLHDMLSSVEALERFQWEAQQEGNILAWTSLTGSAAQVRQGAWLEQNLGYTDWQRLALRDAAKMTNIQFSVQGGKTDIKYYVSGAYTSDDGIMLQNHVEKVNIRAKVDANLSKRAKFGINVSGTYQENTRPVNNFINFYRYPSWMPVMHNDVSTGITGRTGYVWPNQFNGISTPTGPPDANGNPTWDTANPFSSNDPTPAYVMDKTRRGGEVFGSNGNAYLTIDIIDGLQFRTSNGVNFRYEPSSRFIMNSGLKSGDPTASYYANHLAVTLLTENTLNYTKKIGRVHDITGLVGWTAQSDRNEYVYMSGSGFPSDDISTLNAATTFALASGDYINGYDGGTGTFKIPKEMLESYLGRVTYSYDNKYLLSAALRLDRSSLFTKGNRDAWFPSVSAGWRVTEEEFMKPVGWISSLKLRASYGVTGNKRIDYHASQELVANANYSFGSGNGSLIPGLGNTGNVMSNPNVTWEQTDEWNTGLDWSVLGNRINLTLDAYYSITRALLMKVTIPSFSGFNARWNNQGRIRNQGIEVQLNTFNFNSPGFKWETTLNFSMNRNKVLELGGEYQIITLGERNEQYITRVGGPLTQFYGYRTMGTWNYQEEIDNNPSLGSDRVGGLRFYPAAGNDYLSDADRVVLGNPYPDFTWAMTNTFRIKDFDVSFLLQGVQGVDVYNGDYHYNESHKWNKAYFDEHWISPELPGSGKMPAYVKVGTNPLISDAPIENASYACLRNFTVGYTLPDRMIKRTGLKGLRVYATGQNLFYVWSDGYRGINPESRYTSSQYENVLVSGYQRGGFPITSTVTFGLDFNF